MSFKTVRDSIISLLGAAAAGRYQVIGYKPGPLGVDEVSDDNKYVSVTYSEGDFDKSKNAHGNDLLHDCCFDIGLVVSKGASADVAVIDSGLSTEAEVAAVIAAALNSAYLANFEMDNFWDIIFKLIMDPVNIYLGCEEGTVADRWLSEFKKHDPDDLGETTLLSGIAKLTFTVTEEIIGDTDGEALEETDIDLKPTLDEDEEDTVTKTEVKVEY